MKKIIDLSLTMQENWRWPFKLSAKSTFENHFFFHQYMNVDLHGFTHVDALLHFLPNTAPINEVPIEQFMGEATVIDVSHIGENGGVTAADLEKHGGHVKAGDIVLLRTDWPLKCDYLTPDFLGKAPYTARDACEWLVAKKVKTVGSDYPPDHVIRYNVLDPGRKNKPEEYTTHAVLFPKNIFVVEYLCNLHLISKERFLFMALPLTIKGAEGSPVRAIAIED